MERKTASDEATGNRQQATGDEAEMQNAKCKMQNEGSGIKDQGSGNVAAHSVRHRAPSVGAVIGRPPEADTPGIDDMTQKRIARYETLRRIMLILAPILLIGGYALDILPILYAAAVPLAVALLVTYRIKHLEEKQATGNRHQTRS